MQINNYEVLKLISPLYESLNKVLGRKNLLPPPLEEVPKQHDIGQSGEIRPNKT